MSRKTHRRVWPGRDRGGGNALNVANPSLPGVGRPWPRASCFQSSVPGTRKQKGALSRDPLLVLLDRAPLSVYLSLCVFGLKF